MWSPLREESIRWCLPSCFPVPWQLWIRYNESRRVLLLQRSRSPLALPPNLCHTRFESLRYPSDLYISRINSVHLTIGDASIRYYELSDQLSSIRQHHQPVLTVSSPQGKISYMLSMLTFEISLANNRKLLGNRKQLEQVDVVLYRTWTMPNDFGLLKIVYSKNKSNVFYHVHCWYGSF